MDKPTPENLPEPFTLRQWVRHCKGIELTDEQEASFERAVAEHMAQQWDSPERLAVLDELAKLAEELDMGYN